MKCRSCAGRQAFGLRSHVHVLAANNACGGQARGGRPGANGCQSLAITATACLRASQHSLPTETRLGEIKSRRDMGSRAICRALSPAINWQRVDVLVCMSLERKRSFFLIKIFEKLVDQDALVLPRAISGRLHFRDKANCLRHVFLWVI